MIGEVRLAEGVQTRHRGHEVVVDPQAAHRVVGGGVDAHRRVVRVLAGDALVHLEQVAVALPNGLLAVACDRRSEVEVDAVLERADAAALVDHGLGVAARHIARDEVAERRVLLLEEVVALVLRDLGRRAGFVAVTGHPDAAVVAQRFRHEGQLRLELVGGRDAGRVDLGVAGVGEQGALAMGPPRCGDVGGHRVGGEVVHVAVTAGGEHDGMRRVGVHLACEHVAHDDALRLAVLGDDIEHVGAVVQRDLATLDRAGKGLVGAEQELLAGLTPGVEGTAHLGATERAVGEQAAVLTGERHTLRSALVDDVDRYLGEAVHVGFTGPVVAPLHGVVEEAIDRVAVVAVVLRRVDAALSSDRVGTTGGVVEGEDLHVVAELGERGGGRRTGKTGADDDDLELSLVGRVDQLHVELVVVPLVLDGTFRDLCVEHHHGHSPYSRLYWPGVWPSRSISSAWTASGKLRLPSRITAARP